MSEHQLPEQVLAAARDDVAAFRPDRTPPFAAVQARKRRRDLRRGGAALAATALAVTGVVVVPSALTGGASTAPAQTASGDDQRYGYSVTVDGREAISDSAEEALRRCLSLPGLSDGIALDSDPAQYRGTVTGQERADAFVACVEAVPGRAVALDPRTAADREPGLDVDVIAPPAEPAVWDVDQTRPPRPGSRTFTALVARLGCASGETGDVLDPSVRETDDRVDVTFTVVGRTASEAGLCTVNARVPVEVTLEQPVGDRTLVDGTCAEAPARTTSLCLVPQRWPATATGPAPVSDADARALVADLRAFAKDPSATTAEQVPFAPTVRLGLGRELVRQVSARDLRRPESWVVPTGEGYDWIADPSVSALDPLAEDAEHTVVVGPHPHCAGSARPAPPGLEDAQRVSTQPSAPASCLAWNTVDLFLRDGRVEAVTLDLWEP